MAKALQVVVRGQVAMAEALQLAGVGVSGGFRAGAVGMSEKEVAAAAVAVVLAVGSTEAVEATRVLVAVMVVSVATEWMGTAAAAEMAAEVEVMATEMVAMAAEAAVRARAVAARVTLGSEGC